MIEEQGRVVAIEAGGGWGGTLRKSTCSSCSVKAGCGQGLLDQLGASGRRGYVRALSDLRLEVGDAVVIGALFGLFLACLAVRWRSRHTAGDPALQPVVLRALLAGAAVTS